MGVKELMKLNVQKERASLDAKKNQEKKDYASSTLRSIRASGIQTGIQSHHDGYTGGWGQHKRDIVANQFMNRGNYYGLGHSQATVPLTLGHHFKVIEFP